MAELLGVSGAAGGPGAARLSGEAGLSNSLVIAFPFAAAETRARTR